MFEHELLPMAMSVSVALLRPQIVLMSVAPVTTINRKDRVAQSWPCPTLISEQRRTGSAATSCSTLEIRPGKQSSTDYIVGVGDVGLCAIQP